MKLKRIMAIVLCFAMVLSTMSFNVFAEEGVTETTDTVVAKVGNAEFTDIQEAIKEAAPSGTVTLLKDVTVDKWIMISETLGIGDGTIITLDMDGLTIDGAGHTLTVKDIESAGNGNSLFYDGDYNVSNLTLNMATNVNGLGITSGSIENVTFIGGCGISGGAAVHVSDGLINGVHAGDVTIEGCTFKNNGGAIYSETAQDGLVVKNNTFEVPSGANVIMFRGTEQFIGNTVVSGRTVNVVSGSPVVTGNDFGDVRLKVYNDATATIENNVINVLAFDDESTVNSTFGTNELSEEAASVLDSAVFPEDDTTGEGDSEEDIILINTAEELAELRDNVNAGTNYYEGKNVKLNADINLENTNWTPIGSASTEHGFMGNFDGNGHTIYNLTINEPTLDGDGYAYAGLFGVTEGTDKDNQNTIKNLTIENVTISTTGHIVAAAIAYPYYTTVENVKVCGNIDITGGDYTAGVLAYTRRCVDASDLFVEGAAGSTIGGGQVVGGIISDIQMNGGLIANYSNFNASGVTISGTKNVGGISGIIASQTLDTCSVKNVTLDCDDARVGTVAGCLGGVSTISDATVENVSGASALIGGTYDDGKSVEAKIGDKYYATLATAISAAESGDTVTLLCDIENVIEIPDSVTLDTNGYRFGYTAPSGTITNGYVAEKYMNNVSAIYGELSHNAVESIVIKVYSGDVLLATTTANNMHELANIPNLTWHMAFSDDGDGYWTTVWEEDYPVSNVVPDKVALFVDGKKVSENTVKMHGPDGFNPVVWENVNGVNVAVVKVYTFDQLVSALEQSESNIKMMNNITGTATSGGYNLAGIVVKAGDVLDGNGYKLTINGANGTWDCAIAMTGGTVKNLTVANGFRGIFMPGADGDVVIDNVNLENVIYTFNSDAGNTNYSVTIKNTTLNGWTSFSNVHKSVTFDGCTFGEGSGYAFLRPYQSTTFVNCSFAEGYEFDTKATGDNTLSFYDCTYNDAPISNENNELFYAGGSVLVDGKELNIKKGTWGGIDWTLIEGTLTIAPTKGEPELNPNVNDGQTRYAVGAWRENVVYKNGEAASIGGAPYDMKAVKKLIIEEGVISIGSFTAQFPNLTGEVVIPSTVKYIGQEAFQKAPMTKLTFAAGGTEELCIAQGAFKNLIIEEVSLPSDRPVHLHAWVFNNCKNLKSATLPATLVSVHGTNHIDYFNDFNEHSNPTWTKSSEIFAYNENMETINFGSEEVKDMFYANNNGTTKDYLVATVGLTAYSSFDAALEAAEDGDTITLVKNVTLDKSYKFEAGKTITLDLNGKTITGKDNNTSGNFYLFDNRGNLTIKGNGKITLTAANNREWNASSVVVANNPGGKLVIENGTIEHLGGTDMAYGVDNLTNGKGTYAETIINGGTIKSTYRAVRQFLNGVEAQNILTVNGGTIEGANKSIWMQDPSAKANTGTLTVNEGATLNGDVYLFVAAGSTEWPVEVKIAETAVKGAVLSANVPMGHEVVNENGFYGIKNSTASGYKITAVASQSKVRYNNGNPDSFTVKYVVTGGDVIGAMAQLEYDTNLFICDEDPNATGRIRMNSNSLTTDVNGETLLKELHFTVKGNVEVDTTYTFIAKYVQVVSNYDDAGAGTQDGFVENVIGANVTIIAQYDVTLDTEGAIAGNTYVDKNTDYTGTIKEFDENKTYTITYTMGGVEYSIEVEDKTFVIENVTGDIVFTGVEFELNFELILVADAVSGYTLVLVKDGVSAGYTYNGEEMFAVERYVGLTEVADESVFEAEDGVSIKDASSVRAILVKGGVTLDEARNAIAVSATASDNLDISYDVNRNGAFYFNDAMTAHGCYKDQYTLDKNMAKLNWYLSSDVNTDFVVDTNDYDDTVEAFWNTLN